MPDARAACVRSSRMYMQRYVRALDIANCANMALCVILIAYTQLESSVGQGGFQPQGSAPARAVKASPTTMHPAKLGTKMPELLIC